MAIARDPLGKLRKIVAKWPETDERLSHGAPTFWGGKKTFATLHSNHHGDDRNAIWFKAAPGMQDELVDADPDIFFVPPYVGPSGWVGVVLDKRPNWSVVALLVEQAYRRVAHKRLVAQLPGPGENT